MAIDAGTAPDDAVVETFMEKVLDDYAGANAFFMGAIGDRLGLFASLTAGPATSSELAGRTGLQERYLREWLGGMAAASYLAYDPETARYALPPEHAPVLAEEAGPMFLGAAFFDFSTNFGDSFHLLLEAFRSGGGVAQDVHGEEVAESIERFTAPWFENLLVPVWLPTMPEVLSRLETGAAVCDVGCGRGRALIKPAEAFPGCTFTGYDVYAPAIEGATPAGQGCRHRRPRSLRSARRGPGAPRALRCDHDLRRPPRLDRPRGAAQRHPPRPQA